MEATEYVLVHNGQSNWQVGLVHDTGKAEAHVHQRNVDALDKCPCAYVNYNTVQLLTVPLSRHLALHCLVMAATHNKIPNEYKLEGPTKTVR